MCDPHSLHFKVKSVHLFICSKYFCSFLLFFLTVPLFGSMLDVLVLWQKKKGQSDRTVETELLTTSLT